MNQKLQNLKQTTNFVEVNGFGCIHYEGRSIDVEVLGYFKFYHYYFIIHRNYQAPEWLKCSEASTGFCINNDIEYDTLEEMLRHSTNFLETKKYELATAVGKVLVHTRTNLLHRNTTLIQTPAIDLLCGTL